MTTFRELAVDQLADVGTDTAASLLQSFLTDNDRHVRKLAAERLGLAATADY